MEFAFEEAAYRNDIYRVFTHDSVLASCEAVVRRPCLVRYNVARDKPIHKYRLSSSAASGAQWYLPRPGGLLLCDIDENPGPEFRVRYHPTRDIYTLRQHDILSIGYPTAGCSEPTKD